MNKIKNNKVTVNDIAEALGVSSISVSTALSGQTGVGGELNLKNYIRELNYEKEK